MSNKNGSDKINELNDHIDIIVGPRRSFGAKRSGVQPLSAFAMTSAVRAIQTQFGHEPTKVIRPKITKTQSVHGEASEVFCYKMPVDTAMALAQTAGAQVAVEHDTHLTYGSFAPSNLMQQLMGRSRVGASQLREATVKIRVVGDNDQPLDGVSVTLEAVGFPQQGQTNSKGEVTLKLFEIPGGGNPVQSVFVRPNKGYWNRILKTPALTTTGINVIRLKNLTATVPGFPNGAEYGWGQKLMGLDRLPDEFTGKGVKIAIIDSGTDNTHPSLTHATTGFDMTNNQNPQTWSDDVIGHGSHCAGIITGNGPVGEAIRGFAPEAEIITMKVFPGGQVSSLVEALAKCVELGVDVVNMSLGGGEPSDLVEQQIEECVQNGIACIVAAGNSGNEVQYPASSDSTLAVSALGQISEVPADTWEASTMKAANALADGMFSPSFTCHGPEIGVTAPGVGIISTVPGAAFDPQSGTSMAAPHVTGMAALIVAHHAAFKNLPKDPTRVAHLFGLLKQASLRIALPQERVGAGMPSLDRVVASFISGEETAEDATVAMAGAMPGHMPGGMVHAPATNGFAPASMAYGRPGVVVTPQGLYYA